MRYDEICLQIIISTVLVSTDPFLLVHTHISRIGSWDISSFFTANPLHLHHNFTWIWWSPDVWPVNIIQHPKGKATNARHQDVLMIFSWRRLKNIFELTEKKWIPPLVDGQLMWTYHTTSVFYDWWPWWFNYIHFNLPKLSEPLTATPFFFAWLLSFHHIFSLEPPMAQFQNKTYPSKSLVRSTHVKPLFL